MENEFLSRNKENELLVGVIYQILINIDMEEAIDVRSLLANAYQCDFEEVMAYPQEIVIYSLKNLEEIIATFQKNMKNWVFERLNKIEQAILIFAYTQFVYVGGVDRAITINVAVQLAKKYLDKDDFKFVNAILDNTLPKNVQ